MAIGRRFLERPRPCSYLPDRPARMEYEWADRLTSAEYLDRMNEGWRRFGRTLFRPRCPACRACQPLRVDVDRFRPDRSQRRAWKANSGEVLLEIGPPGVDDESLDLSRRYHEAQTEAKDWPEHEEDSGSFVASFVDNPFPTLCWRYRLGTELVGVGFVDDVPAALSAIYFFHDPAHRDRSLGTFNVLSVIDRARAWGKRYVYLGYYVEGCRSMQYKARFRPNQVLGVDGTWKDMSGA